MIPVFYRPEQSCDDAVRVSPSAGKPALVVSDWVAHPEISRHLVLTSFEPASNEILYAAHGRAYVDGVLSCQRVNGFGTKSPSIAASLPYTTGSMLAAALHVLSSRTPGFNVAVSPTSGFHHACHSSGGGFCTFNALMATAIHVHALGLARKILIVDMDEHYGNGTDDIIEQLGIAFVDHITATKSYRTAAQALQCADLANHQGLRDKRYDLVLYQAGADIHVDDPLGGLLTTQQMITRDELVFASCAKLGLPLVWNLAGGYQRDPRGGIDPVLALHRNTMLACIRQAVSAGIGAGSIEKREENANPVLESFK